MRAVVDSSAILGGFEPAPPSEFAVPPTVVDEVARGREGRRMQELLAAGLEVREPSLASLERVRAAASALGESGRLSPADVDVLALALDLAIPCLSDDYSIQNVASRAGVEVRPFREGGIREVWTWGVRCPGCRRWTPEGRPGGECPVCGSQLRSARRRARRGASPETGGEG